MSKISKMAEADLHTSFGNFRITGFSYEGQPCVALHIGDIAGKNNVLTRIQSSCLFGETFGAVSCDCRWQINHSLVKISEQREGVFIYLFQEGRGVGIVEKIHAYSIEQTKKVDTVEAFRMLGFDRSDKREYDVAAEVIRSFNISSVNLLTNNPEKLEAIKRNGIEAQHTPISMEADDFKKLSQYANVHDLQGLISYLETKRKKLGHEYETNALKEIIAQMKAKGK